MSSSKADGAVNPLAGRWSRPARPTTFGLQFRRDGAQAVVWQTAINPVVALELLAAGVWQGAGVLGPEAFPPRPFLDLLVDYGSPWGLREG